MKNETYEKVVKLLMSMRSHRYCDDGYYACPKNEEYFGQYSDLPIEQRPCECQAEGVEEILKEMGVIL